jgi:ABC-2 type transport system permease protein
MTHEPAPDAGADGRRRRERRSWVRRGGRMAWLELRRRLRQLRARPRSTAARVLFYVGLWLWVLEPWNPRGTEAVGASGEAADLAVLGVMRGGVALAWVGLVAIEALSATTSVDDVDAGAAVIPAAGVRATLLATQVVEHARRLTILGVLAVMGLVSFALGTGSTGVLGVGLVAFVGLTATARLTGEVVGMTYAAVAGESHLRGYAPVVAVAVALVTAVVLTRFFAQAAALVTWLPPAWYADLMLLGTPGVAPDPVRAVGAVAGTLLALPVLFLVAERLAVSVWFDPGGGPAPDERRPARGSVPTATRVARRLARAVPVSGATRAVAWRVTVRSLRRPQSLVMMALPVLLGATVVLASEHVHDWLPVMLAFYGAWAAGAGVTLNPLASEGVGLPGLLTAPVTGRQVVGGYVLTGLALSAPLVVAIPLGAGAYAGSPALTVGGAVLLGLVVAAGGSALAVAVGVLLPRLGAMSATDVDAPAAPQRVAFVAYSVGVVVIGAPGAAGLLVDGPVAGAPVASVAAAGLAGTVLLAGLLGVPAAAYAGRRLTGYELSA